MKLCKGPCGRELDESKFYKHPETKDRLRSKCKDCWREYHKQHYAANKEAAAERHKRYYAANREAILEQKKQYQAENREAKAEYDKQRYEKDPAGVYQLTNITTGDIYFGQTVALNNRRRHHFQAIANKCHENPKVHELSLTYGPEHWNFEVLMLEDDFDERREYEAVFIEVVPCLNIRLNSEVQ